MEMSLQEALRQLEARGESKQNRERVVTPFQPRAGAAMQARQVTVNGVRRKLDVAQAMLREARGQEAPDAFATGGVAAHGARRTSTSCSTCTGSRRRARTTNSRAAATRSNNSSSSTTTATPTRRGTTRLRVARVALK